MITINFTIDCWCVSTIALNWEQFMILGHSQHGESL